MKIIPRVAISLLLLHPVFSKPEPVDSERGDLNLAGIPNYRVYEGIDIGDTSQGNFITSAPDGRLFYGSESGLFVFDGTSWSWFYKTLTTRDTIRCLVWADSGLYGAGYGRIGKFEPSRDQGVVFKEITPDALELAENEFLASAHRIGQELFFIGGQAVVVHDLSNSTTEIHKLNTWTKGSAVIKDRLYLATEDRGLLTFTKRAFSSIPAFERFVGPDAITNFVSSEKDETFFLTQKGDIYHLPSEGPLDSHYRVDFYSPQPPSDICVLNEHHVALSIPGVGIEIIDKGGQVQTTLSKNIDYRLTSAGQIHSDSDGTLWSLSDTSIAKILTDSPLTAIDERIRPKLYYPTLEEANGTAYLNNSSKILQPGYNEHGELRRFENSLPDFEISITEILPAPDGLYLFADEGVYLHTEETTLKISEARHIKRAHLFDSSPRKILASSPEQILVLERRENQLITLASAASRTEFVNRIECDSSDTFWLEFGTGALQKVEYADGAIRISEYNQSHGLPPNWVTLWKHETEVYFPERTGIYQYKKKEDSFSKSDILARYFDSDAGPYHRIDTDPRGNIWVSYNSSNHILWKQEDGTYKKDSHSLAHLGKLYVNHYKFLSNGDTILLTAHQMFHFRSKRLDRIKSAKPRGPILSSITSADGTKTYYKNLGSKQEQPHFSFDTESRTLAFHFFNPNSETRKRPAFSSFLEGETGEWSSWSGENRFEFSRLAPGEYTLRVKSRPGGAHEDTEIAVPFSIKARFSETPLASLLYLLAAGAVVGIGYKLFSKRLKDRNSKLEVMVAERTQTIEKKNQELTKALTELRDAQDMIMATSRKAGMAEVATNVLHNVGNVLNSINVGILSLSERLEQERVTKLSRVSDLINDNQDRLPEFLTKDPKGKAIPSYLTQLSNVLRDDFAHYQVEVDCIQENIEHIKKIIATQQTHAKTVEVLQTVRVPELIDSAVELTMGDLEHSIYEISTDFEQNLEIVSDKHSILQMVTNFIKNAKESIQEQGVPLGLITVSAKTGQDPKFIRIQITDNGIGIPEGNLRKLFTHGFTTKKDGHGFGMHSSANAAKALGGSLQIESKGLGKGATVTLTLPKSPKNK